MEEKAVQATVITAPQSINAIDGFKVFLAGAIDMGQAIDWQARVIQTFLDLPGLVLLNPRREQFTPDMEEEQIRWELNALSQANAIIMWFPANAKAPIALFESGLFMKSGKLVIGAEPGFYRRKNLELTCDLYGVKLWPDLDLIMGEIYDLFLHATALAEEA